MFVSTGLDPRGVHPVTAPQKARCLRIERNRRTSPTAPTRSGDREGMWSCCWDLNPGPLPYQGSALPLSYSSMLRSSPERRSHESLGNLIEKNATGFAPSSPRREARQEKGGGAGEGDRTLTTSLEGWGSTIELRPPMNSADKEQTRPYPRPLCALRFEVRRQAGTVVGGRSWIRTSEG